MTTVSEDPNENAKCGVLEDTFWEDFQNWNSLDGRRLAFTSSNGKNYLKDLCLSDLFHMIKKKYPISLDSLPTDMELDSFKAVHWFHEDKALVLILLCNKQAQTEEFYSALMEINHDQSRCILRDVQSLNKRLEGQTGGRFCKLVPLPNGLGIVLMGIPYLPRSTAFHVFSNSADGQLKWAKSTFLPDQFCPMGVVDGFIYGFSYVKEYMNLSQLVKVCMETNKQTKLDVVTPVRRVKYLEGSWVWIGRKLVTSCDVRPGHTSCRQLFTLDVDSLRWSQLEFGLSDYIDTLIYDGDNTLIVITNSGWVNGITFKVYRFAINRPDTLGNISWTAIRNHAKKSPGFDRHALSLLPKNSPFHCVLGTRPSVKRPASNSPSTSVSSKKTRD